jgi:hypothetical protein
MRQEVIDYIVKDLKRNLIESQRLWDEKDQSHAYIIGYLEGAIKGTIAILDSNKETENK